MLEFLANYGLFLAKAVTLVAAILICLAGIIAIGKGGRKGEKGELEVECLNDHYQDLQDKLQQSVLDDQVAGELTKHQEKERKEALDKQRKEWKKDIKKGNISKLEEGRKKRIYSIDFKGDIKASAVENLRREITAILSVATTKDEVVVKVESPGGMVHTYGLAASQLRRITSKNIPLTICVDKVAASGGYMMACVGDKILAAPFAIVGSIGVMAEVPNVNRLLKKFDIDYDVMTAGEYKAPITVMGENTEKGKQKFLDDLDDTHKLFKGFVSQNRPVVDIDKVATGEIWYGAPAVDVKLVDEIKTSDEYLVEQLSDADVYTVEYKEKKNVAEKFGLAAQSSLDQLLLTWWERLTTRR